MTDENNRAILISLHTSRTLRLGTLQNYETEHDERCIQGLAYSFFNF